MECSERARTSPPLSGRCWKSGHTLTSSLWHLDEQNLLPQDWREPWLMPWGEDRSRL